MASSVLYRGAMTINNSTRFLAALQALQFVADRGLKLWEPLTLSANHKVPNLMGTELDDDQAIAETQLLTSADATPIMRWLGTHQLSAPQTADVLKDRGSAVVLSVFMLVRMRWK
eukprot:GDKK01010233.1.p1 GENE.GDKK01010233.1~~GDKK01010233.1.p1  ORF type:complete len:115 (-),score=11.71 GDKK01010233.1:66-410(-)